MTFEAWRATRRLITFQEGDDPTTPAFVYGPGLNVIEIRGNIFHVMWMNSYVDTPSLDEAEMRLYVCAEREDLL